MFTATKIKTKIKPKTFESLNNGIWYYNYDIVEKTIVTRDLSDDEDREEQRYEFVQVRINGEPTLGKCTEAILKVYKDEGGTSLYESRTMNIEDRYLYEDILYMIRVDFGLEELISSLEIAKKKKIRMIDDYDNSDNVNSFYFNGVKVWLNKDTRVGLMNSLTIEKNAGKEESTLWFNNICVNIKCDAAIQMLSSLELYALDCYNKTAEHKVAIQELDDIDDVISYDFTEGYPNKLVFTTQ